VTSTLDHVELPPFRIDPLRLIYVQVAEHIAARIQAGELPGGQRLAPERDIATEYGVAYNTIRKSMELLREQGLIVTMHGRGTFVVPEDQRPHQS
jgi:GntR family transcriptional regulator